MDETIVGEIDLSGQIYEPWLFLSMLEQLSAGDELGIGSIYSALDLLAQRYRLSDAVVVLQDDSLDTQTFRLGRASVAGDSALSSLTTPGVRCDPDVVPDLVREVVRSVCQLSLRVHLARWDADDGLLTKVANQRHFDAALRAAAMQSSRYGWPFTLVLIELKGSAAERAGEGRREADELRRHVGRALRQSVRYGDVVAHVGDDEFAIILWSAEGTEVLAFTERLRDPRLPTAAVDMSIGAATAPGDSSDPGELRRLAGARLNEKKGTSSGDAGPR